MYSDDGLRLRLAPLLATSAGEGMQRAARAPAPPLLLAAAAAAMPGRRRRRGWQRASLARSARRAELTADLAHMGRLLDAAKSEVYVFSKPRTFPTEQYR